MVNIEYNHEENKFQKWYHGTEPARIQCWVVDLNTNLTVHSWYTDFSREGYAEWGLPEKYYKAEYNSGFELLAYIGEEQVFSKKFQLNKLDNRFYFSSPHNELNFGYAEAPDQHKCGHVIELEDGNYAIQPNNRLRVYDSNMGIDTNKTLIDRLVNTKIWSVEDTAKWITTEKEQGSYDYEYKEIKDE